MLRGRPVLPGFTAEGPLRAWRAATGAYATAPAHVFLPTLVSGPFAGLVLNPGSPTAVFVERSAIELLAKRAGASLCPG